jgi:thioredoxin reductase (NADPH)
VVRTADPDSAACPIGQDGAPAVCHRSGAAHYLLQQFFDHCDPAMEEALYLTRFGSEVVVLHRREEFRASRVMLERAKKNPKIKFKVPYALEDTHGEKTLEQLKIKNLKTGAVETLAAAGLFLAIGHEPNTALFKDRIKLDDVGYVLTDGHARTNVEGVFAAGDCVDHVYRQAITAAGQGCMAAIQAERWLAEHN